MVTCGWKLNCSPLALTRLNPTKLSWTTLTKKSLFFFKDQFFLNRNVCSFLQRALGDNFKRFFNQKNVTLTLLSQQISLLNCAKILFSKIGASKGLKSKPTRLKLNPKYIAWKQGAFRKSNFLPFFCHNLFILTLSI